MWTRFTVKPTSYGRNKMGIQPYKGVGISALLAIGAAVQSMLQAQDCYHLKVT